MNDTSFPEEGKDLLKEEVQEPIVPVTPDPTVQEEPELPEEAPQLTAETETLPAVEPEQQPTVEAEPTAEQEVLLAPPAEQQTADFDMVGFLEQIDSAVDEAVFEETTESEKPQEQPAAEPEPVRKGRPKRKKGEGFFGIPNFLVTMVWIALTLFIGLTLGRLVWICAADVLAFGREDKPVTITVYESDSIEQITDKLYKAELIRYPGLFKLYASFAVDEGEIHPGIWDLNTRYDYHALVKMMSPSSSREVIKVMIPEGYTCRQIFALLEENKVCTAQDIAAYAANGELNDYWFLDGVTRGDQYCLEGFLFPDTYEFYTNDSPRNVLNKLLGNFENRFDEEMRAQIDLLNGHLADLMRTDGRSAEYIAQHLFGIRELVTVASMVEKETSSAEESHTIASVIYNRLFHWGSTPAYLNIDATVIYALNGKTDLTLEDLRVDSPYNTYTNVGLTPGPISNPGLASLKACLTPESTNYYFYVLDPAVGSHHFSRTQEEHDAFRASLGG